MSSGHFSDSEASQIEFDKEQAEKARKEEKVAAKARGASGTTHADGGTVNERPDPGMSYTEMGAMEDSNAAMLQKLIDGN